MRLTARMADERTSEAAAAAAAAASAAARGSVDSSGWHCPTETATRRIGGNQGIGKAPMRDAAREDAIGAAADRDDDARRGGGAAARGCAGAELTTKVETADDGEISRARRA